MFQTSLINFLSSLSFSVIYELLPLIIILYTDYIFSLLYPHLGTKLNAFIKEILKQFFTYIDNFFVN